MRESYGIPRDPDLKLKDFPTLNHAVQFVKDRMPADDAATTAEPSAATATSVAAPEAAVAGDMEAAEFVGIPAYLVPTSPESAPGPEAIAFVAPLFEKAGLAMAINDAWGLVALLTLAAFIVLPLAREVPKTATGESDKV